MSLRTLAVAALLMSAPGCRATSPVAVVAPEELAAPAPEICRVVAPVAPPLAAEPGAAAPPAWSGPRARTPYLRNAEAWIAGDSLYIRARVHGVGQPWNAGAFLDTRNDDPDPAHSYLGWDYIAEMYEVDDAGTYPVRFTLPNQSDGGWGWIAGRGALYNRRHLIHTAIPLQALVIDHTENRIKVHLMLFAGEIFAFVDLEAALNPRREAITHRETAPATPRRL